MAEKKHSRAKASTKQTAERRNPRLLIFMLIGLCILFIISYASRLIEHARVQAEVVVQDNRIAEAQKEQAELEAQRDFVQSDAYVEEVARNELGLAKPGDSVVILLPDTDSLSTSSKADNAVPNQQADAMALPNWQQWLHLFTQESPPTLQ